MIKNILKKMTDSPVDQMDPQAIQVACLAVYTSAYGAAMANPSARYEHASPDPKRAEMLADRAVMQFMMMLDGKGVRARAEESNG